MSSTTNELSSKASIRFRDVSAGFSQYFLDHPNVFLLNPEHLWKSTTKLPLLNLYSQGFTECVLPLAREEHEGSFLWCVVKVSDIQKLEANVRIQVYDLGFLPITETERQQIMAMFDITGYKCYLCEVGERFFPVDADATNSWAYLLPTIKRAYGSEVAAVDIAKEHTALTAAVERDMEQYSHQWKMAERATLQLIPTLEPSSQMYMALFQMPSQTMLSNRQQIFADYLASITTRAMATSSHLKKTTQQIVYLIKLLRILALPTASYRQFHIVLCPDDIDPDLALGNLAAVDFVVLKPTLARQLIKTVLELRKLLRVTLSIGDSTASIPTVMLLHKAWQQKQTRAALLWLQQHLDLIIMDGHLNIFECANLLSCLGEPEQTTLLLDVVDDVCWNDLRIAQLLLYIPRHTWSAQLELLRVQNARVSVLLAGAVLFTASDKLNLVFAAYPFYKNHYDRQELLDFIGEEFRGLFTGSVTLIPQLCTNLRNLGGINATLFFRCVTIHLKRAWQLQQLINCFDVSERFKICERYAEIHMTFEEMLRVLRELPQKDYVAFVKMHAYTIVTPFHERCIKAKLPVEDQLALNQALHPAHAVVSGSIILHS